MSLLEKPVWHGIAFSGGWVQPGGGDAQVSGVTVRGEIALSPF